MSHACDARPRLLILTPDFPPEHGGVQVLAHRLAVRLTGFEVEVVTLGGAGASGFDRHSAFPTCRVHRGHGLAGMLALNAAAMRRALGFRPDVTLSAHAVVSPAAASIRRLIGARTAQYFYAVEIIHKPRLSAFAARRADLAIAISNHTASLIAGVGASRANLQVIPPGVDIPVDTRARLAGRPTVLTISQLRYAYKGHDVLIPALARVRELVPEVEWVIIGDGPLRAPLERLAREHDLDGAARFLGALSDEERDDWLRRADVLAMPSRDAGEGFGIAYLEAGAHGKPVVAGDVAGAREAVQDGVTGLLVDPTDAAAVADGLAHLLRDRDLARRLGARAAKRAQEFAWPLIAARVEAALLELLDSAR